MSTHDNLWTATLASATSDLVAHGAGRSGRPPPRLARRSPRTRATNSSLSIAVIVAIAHSADHRALTGSICSPPAKSSPSAHHVAPHWRPATHAIRPAGATCWNSSFPPIYSSLGVNPEDRRDGPDPDAECNLRRQSFLLSSSSRALLISAGCWINALLT